MNGHDEDCPENGFYANEIPCWRFSFWDVAGITAFTVGQVAAAVSNGFGLFAREFQAAAQQSRQNAEVREAQELNRAARQELAAGLEQIVGMTRPEDCS